MSLRLFIYIFLSIMLIQSAIAYLQLKVVNLTLESMDLMYILCPKTS